MPRTGTPKVCQRICGDPASSDTPAPRSPGLPDLAAFQQYGGRADADPDFFPCRTVIRTPGGESAGMSQRRRIPRSLTVSTPVLRRFTFRKAALLLSDYAEDCACVIPLSPARATGRPSGRPVRRCATTCTRHRRPQESCRLHPAFPWAGRAASAFCL